MLPLAPILVCIGLSTGSSLAPKQDYGSLWQPAYALDTVRRAPSRPYEPQPGDLIIMNSTQVLWKLSYRLAFSAPPTHAGIIVQAADGKIGVLEAGIGNQTIVAITPLKERLEEYAGDVYIRQRKAPLSDAECARLTEFALAVNKKRMPVVRLVKQLTPFRCRGPIRTEFFGKPQGVIQGYFCSELVVEACVAAGVMDGQTARPRATFPHDLFFERSSNPFLRKHLNLSAGWHPPALWTGDDGTPRPARYEDGHPTASKVSPLPASRRKNAR